MTTRYKSSHFPACLTNIQIHLTKNRAFYPTVEKSGHKKLSLVEKAQQHKLLTELYHVP